MRISIIGSGYVGLVTAACLADIGNEVLCIDINEQKIKNLQKNVIPIYEPGLEEIVKRNAKAGRLKFSTTLRESTKTEIIFIAVGTPPKEYGHADLTSVYQVAKGIGDSINRRTIIVNKSTVPVGTAREVESIIAGQLRKRRKKIEFSVVSNPEFLKEGAAIDDFMKPDRIVLGVNKKWASQKMNELYKPFIKNGHQILIMDRESSEMSKYASNAMLACKISFMNQLATLCEIVGADIEKVRGAMSLDVRIGSYFLYAGVGYGGSCFPKDVQALGALAKQYGYSAHLLEAIEIVNNQQKSLLPKKLIKTFKNIEGKKIAIWGLAFKPNTDDIRDAPSITIIEDILAKGGKISAYDPKAFPQIKKYFNDRIDYANDMYAACRDADALMVITEWSEFREPDFDKLKKLLRNPIIFDGRNIYDPQLIKKLGFRYVGIGR